MKRLSLEMHFFEKLPSVCIRRLISRSISLFSHFLVTLAISANAQYGPESGFLARVNASYLNRPIIKTEFNEEDRKKYGDVNQFRHYRFTSERLADGYKNFNPELTLTVYDYKEPEAPLAAMIALQKASKNWKIKTPEVAIAYGNSLYRLKGHCDIPDNTWQWMTDLLYDSILGRGKTPDNVFVLACGQQRNPVELGNPKEGRPTLKRRDGDSDTVSEARTQERATVTATYTWLLTKPKNKSSWQRDQPAFAGSGSPEGCPKQVVGAVDSAVLRTSFAARSATLNGPLIRKACQAGASPATT